MKERIGTTKNSGLTVSMKMIMNDGSHMGSKCFLQHIKLVLKIYKETGTGNGNVNKNNTKMPGDYGKEMIEFHKFISSLRKETD